jgi:folate-binding protein YgfZ
MAPISPHIPVSEADIIDWPADFGSVRDEFAALKSTCGVYHLAERATIQLTGGDRVRWLNGMVTNNVRDLAVGHGIYAFLLNPQGRILGDLTAYNRGESILVDTHQSQLEKILATFEHYIIMDDVEMTNISGQRTTIGLRGSASAAVLNAVGLDLPNLQPLEIADLSWQQFPVSVVRGESERYPSYEIWIAPENGFILRKALETAGASPVGRDALEIYRVALGLPRYGQDIRERDLPQETEQQRALNFNKGCYVGQEIVERIRSRGNVHRTFTGFQVHGAPPAPGRKIRTQERDVGEFTSSAAVPAPDGNHTIALGYVRREVGVAGKEVQVSDSTALVTELPFNALLAT